MAEWMRCPFCGRKNFVDRAECEYCHCSLKIPLFGQPSREAEEHFQRAIEKWNGAKNDNADDILKLDVASELALAIKKANAPFPRAHAYLAMILNDMGNDADAERHANIALLQNPNEFRAQLIKIDTALKGVKIVKLRPGDFVHVEDYGRGDMAEKVVGTALVSLVGTATKSLASVLAAGSASATQNNFRREAEKLIAIFRNVCVSNTDAKEYLMMGETLVALGDMIKETPQLRDVRRMLYTEVISVSIENLESQGHEKGIANTRTKAEGRLLLLGG